MATNGDRNLAIDRIEDRRMCDGRVLDRPAAG